MANIAITSECNLHCRYCFTQGEFKSGVRNYGHMTQRIFESALDFVMRSKCGQIRILGGEPTLHPQVIPFLEMAQRTGQPIRLFSNGLMPDAVLECLSAMPEDVITVIVNLTHWDEMPELTPRLKKTLSALNRKIMPGVNIAHRATRLNFLLNLIRDFNLMKQIRLGLAHPCIGYQNTYLPPKHYSLVGHRIADFARAARAQSITINLDCGVVPCMFNGENMSALGLNPMAGTHCEPIPDILPDGNIVPCYPLSRLVRLPLTATITVETVRSQFQNALSKYQLVGASKFCSLCDDNRSGACTGGCVAQKFMRLSPPHGTIIAESPRS